MTPSTSPVRVAVVNDYALVVAGVAAMLEPFRDRVRVVEIDAGLPVLVDVDVILYDTFGQPQGAAVDMDSLSTGGAARVVIYSWNLQRELVEASLRAGASGYLSKSLEGKELVDAIEEVHRGTIVVPDDLVVQPDDEPEAEVTRTAYPGQVNGLTAREAEIVALITQGLSNQEIADRSYLSINSVKTYVRTAYRKMGVERRSQAVLWGIQHGFEPDVLRRVRSTD